MFTTQEETLMRKYIEKYATSNPLPLDQILAPWKEAKSKYLLPLLGGLTLSKKINIKHSITQDDIYRQFYCSKEYQNFNNLLGKKINNLYDDWYKKIPNIDYKNNSLKEAYTIADKTFLAGTKPYKVFKYIFNKTNSTPEEFQILENFRIFHSKYLEPQEVNETLVLSIHPMDFFTASDNNYDWRSCMHWNGGEYRAGTLEMLNSPFILIAYLDGSKPFFPLRNSQEQWANKKWREYFIVTPGFISGIRGYPYNSLELEQEVINWISNLANEKYLSYTTSEDYIEDSFHNQLYFCTYRHMYNDFTNSHEHISAIKEGYTFSHPKDYFDYSSPAYYLDTGEEIENEEELASTDSIYCYNCGCQLYENDATYIDNRCYCEDCVNDLFTWCNNCEEYVPNDEAEAIDIEYTLNNRQYHEFACYLCHDCIENNHIDEFEGQYYISSKTPTRIYYKPTNAQIIDHYEEN